MAERERNGNDEPHQMVPRRTSVQTFAPFPRLRALFCRRCPSGRPACGMSCSPPRAAIAVQATAFSFTVTGGRVSSTGSGRVSGTVNRNGGVAVSVAVGASRASGGGQLTGNSGAGSWSAIISGERGTWQASRS